jgi:ADP-ribose pyrophosphatase YjhB (NUDIX family)
LLASKFTIRVYGICLNNNKILCCKETNLQNAIHFFKFPGGGLEFGEGIEDCLKREFIEELGIEPEIKNIFYVNPFYQQSVFNAQHQVISIYYFVEIGDKLIPEKTIEKRGDFDWEITFRWLEMDIANIQKFTFPIDKIVFEKLIENQRNN